MGNSEKPWCPVRALRHYLHRTTFQRKSVPSDHLFLTSTRPYRPATKATLSRWIISIVTDSLSQSASTYDNNQTTRALAHDLRSQVSSWALYKGSSLSDIIEAAGWRTSTTFQQVYMKDVLTSGQRVVVAALSRSRDSRQ